MVQNNLDEQFDVQESYNYYVAGDNSKYNAYSNNCGEINALGWYLYLKYSMLKWEEVLHWEEESKPFFNESFNPEMKDDAQQDE